MNNKTVYLSFYEYADLLAETIKGQSRENSFVIAVTGSWGCGKTTLMNLTLDRLDNDKFIKVVFKAWRYTKEDAIWRGFFISIIESLRKHLSDDKIMDEIGWEKEDLDLCNMLFDDTERSLYTAFTREIPGEISIDTGNLAKTSFKMALKFIPFGEIGPEWVEKIFRGSTDKKSDSSAINQIDVENILGFFKRSIIKQETEKLTSMEQFRLSMEKLLSAVLCGDYKDPNPKNKLRPMSKPLKLIVAIDDLDRCLPEQALEIFEAIKLFLDLPKTNFIVALDQNIIQHALNIRYKQGELKRPQISTYNYT